MNINKALVKAYEGKSLKELLVAPVDALQGVSASDAQKLDQAFGIKTINDMANNKYFKWARAMVILADVEE